MKAPFQLLEPLQYLQLTITRACIVLSIHTNGGVDNDIANNDSVIEVLVPRAFLKYSTCMVYSEFLLSGKNPPLERGGQKPIVN